MTLVKCSECGQDISDQALNCPHCGLPLISQEIEKDNSDRNVEPNINKYEKTDKKWKKYLALATPLLIIGLPIFIFNLMMGVMSSATGQQIGGSAGWFFVGFLFSLAGGVMLLVAIIGNWWERG